VIERDAVALLLAKDPELALRMPHLNLESVIDPSCRALIERIQSCGLEVAIYDITSDVRVPTYYCRLNGQDVISSRRSAAVDGAGCYPLSAVAMQRAILEAAQTRALLISGARDDIRARYYLGSNWRATGATFLLEPEDMAADLTTAQLLSHVQRQLDNVGLHPALIIDLERDPQAIHVVRVVVPGLEGSVHSRHFVPGQRSKAVTASS
jgi:ribosomal protein S12 methylthiotransferase accessory factor